MELKDRLNDYCLRRAIRKGKEEKVYRMLSEANCLIHTRPLKGSKLLRRAGNIVDHDIYGIDSGRVIDEWTTAELMYSRHTAE